MRIVCPSCDSEYDVPLTRMKPGKMVRCARCGGEWVASELEADATHGLAQTPLDLETNAAAEAPAEAAAIDHVAASRSPPPSRLGLVAAWVLTVLVLVVAVSATIAWRHDVVRHWPPSSRILGVPDYSSAKPAPAPSPVPGQAHETN